MLGAMPLNLDDLERAQRLVYQHMAPTPQYAWPLLCQALGRETWVKHENHTPTGAFKVRGGLTYLDALSRRHAPPAQLITATRGNHGQSIPFAASRFGLKTTVLVPQGNSTEKNAAMQAWGATLEVFGDDFDAARAEAERRAAEGEAEMVPSFHNDLILGVATYGLELMTAVADLDAIYVPIGMGSGICSLIRVRDALGVRTDIVGVVSDAADAMARSVEQGRIVETATANTLADGMACRVPHPEAFAEIQRGAARIVRVSDAEVAEAIRLLYRATHNVAEGAGAAACAAAALERARGGRVAVILTGGNIDSDQLADILSAG